jgi:hypothetical protein
MRQMPKVRSDESGRHGRHALIVALGDRLITCSRTSNRRGRSTTADSLSAQPTSGYVPQ